MDQVQIESKPNDAPATPGLELPNVAWSSTSWHAVEARGAAKARKEKAEAEASVLAPPVIDLEFQEEEEEEEDGDDNSSAWSRAADAGLAGDAEDEGNVGGGDALASMDVGTDTSREEGKAAALSPAAVAPRPTPSPRRHTSLVEEGKAAAPSPAAVAPRPTTSPRRLTSLVDTQSALAVSITVVLDLLVIGALPVALIVCFHFLGRAVVRNAEVASDAEEERLAFIAGAEPWAISTPRMVFYVLVVWTITQVVVLSKPRLRHPYSLLGFISAGFVALIVTVVAVPEIAIEETSKTFTYGPEHWGNCTMLGEHPQITKLCPQHGNVRPFVTAITNTLDDPLVPLEVGAATSPSWAAHNDPNTAALAALGEIGTFSKMLVLFESAFSPTLQAPYVQTFQHSSECGSKLLEVMCSITLPGCGESDCRHDPVEICSLAALQDLASCKGQDIETFVHEAGLVAAFLENDPPDWIRTAVSPQIIRAQQHWWRWVSRANLTLVNSSLADHCPGTTVQGQPNGEQDPKSSGASFANSSNSGRLTTCRAGSSRVASTRRVDMRRTVRGIALLAAVAIALIALGLERSRTTSAVKIMRQRLCTDAQGFLRVLVIVVGGLTSLTVFAAGVQVDVFPGGVDPIGSTACRSSSAGATNAATAKKDSWDPQQWSGWALGYYGASFLALNVCAQVLLPISLFADEERRLRRASESFHRQLSRRRHGALRGFVDKVQSSWIGHLYHRWQTQFAHPVHSHRYGLKIAVVEVAEISLQIVQWTTSWETQESHVVLTTGLLVLANIAVVPTMMFAASFSFHREQPVRLLALACEVVFDQMYIVTLLFLRVPAADTLSGASTFDIVVYHCSCLLPALMSPLTLQDMLSLDKACVCKNDRKNAKALDILDGKSRKKFRRDASGLHRRCSGKIKLATVLIGLNWLLALAGLAVIAAYSSSCDRYWEAEFGSAAHCIRPRLYWASSDVARGDSSVRCGAHLAASFDCHKADIADVPESQVYGHMSSLTCINVSHNPGFKRIPTTWGLLQNLSSIDASQSEAAELPWQVCAGAQMHRVATIDVEGSPAAVAVNWAAVKPPLKSLSEISQACRNAVYRTACSLDVSQNQINDQAVLVRDFEPFERLLAINMSRNGIMNVTADSSSGYPFSVAMQKRFPGSQDPSSWDLAACLGGGGH